MHFDNWFFAEVISSFVQIVARNGLGGQELECFRILQSQLFRNFESIDEQRGSALAAGVFQEMENLK